MVQVLSGSPPTLIVVLLFVSLFLADSARPVVAITNYAAHSRSHSHLLFHPDLIPALIGQSKWVSGSKTNAMKEPAKRIILRVFRHSGSLVIILSTFIASPTSRFDLR